MAGCSISGCDGVAVARGLCDKHRKRLSRHGHTKQTRPADWGARTSHPLYKQWHGIIRRCHDQKHKDFCNYGARGIRVCERWHDFWAFLHDMGERPSEMHSVGRADNNGDYHRENCRWETPTQQARNRRSTVVTEEMAIEIKRRVRRGERTGDIARSMSIDYENVRSVVTGHSFVDVNASDGDK